MGRSASPPRRWSQLLVRGTLGYRRGPRAATSPFDVLGGQRSPGVSAASLPTPGGGGGLSARSSSMGSRSVSRHRTPGSMPCAASTRNTASLAAAAVSYTHLRAHETDSYLVCRLL